jgi:hypothetical protein
VQSWKVIEGFGSVMGLGLELGSNWDWVWGSLFPWISQHPLYGVTAVALRSASVLDVCMQST